MQLVVIDTSPQLRASLIGRVQEAARQAGLTRIATAEVDPLNLDEVAWDATIGVFIGVGCGAMVKELLNKMLATNTPAKFALVLDAETYASDAVAIHKVLSRTVINETDLTQMANFIVDCEKETSGRPDGVRVRHIIGVAQLKGGVGASTCAASIAKSLCKLGMTVALIDGDDLSPHITSWGRVGVAQRTLIGELLRNGEIPSDRLRDIIQSVPSTEGRLVVVGQPLLYSESFHLKSYVLEGSPASSAFIDSILSLLSIEYDVVLIDLGRSWGVATFAALPWCEKVCLVLDDDGLTVHRTLENLARLKNESGDPEEFNFGKWVVVLNRYTGERLSARELSTAIGDSELFPKVPALFPISFSQRGRQWGIEGETLYDRGGRKTQREIDNLSLELAPRSFAKKAYSASGSQRLHFMSRWLGK